MSLIAQENVARNIEWCNRPSNTCHQENVAAKFALHTLTNLSFDKGRYVLVTLLYQVHIAKA
jgi:hypothetical protein